MSIVWQYESDIFGNTTFCVADLEAWLQGEQAQSVISEFALNGCGTKAELEAELRGCFVAIDLAELEADDIEHLAAQENEADAALAIEAEAARRYV